MALVLRFGLRFAIFWSGLGSSRCRHPSQAGPGSARRVPLAPGVFFQPFRATTLAVAAWCGGSAMWSLSFCWALPLRMWSYTFRGRRPFPRPIAKRAASAAQRQMLNSSPRPNRNEPVLIHHARTCKSFRHKLVSDRPDYLALASLDW